jgi:hypothetical protein
MYNQATQAAIGVAQNKISMLEAGRNDLSSVNETLNNVAVRLYQFKGRAIGNPPEPEACGKLNPVSSGALGSLAEEIATARTISNRLQELMTQIEQIA